VYKYSENTSLKTQPTFDQGRRRFNHWILDPMEPLNSRDYKPTTEMVFQLCVRSELLKSSVVGNLVDISGGWSEPEPTLVYISSHF
jgi:hypothetical protein